MTGNDSTESGVENVTTQNDSVDKLGKNENAEQQAVYAPAETGSSHKTRDLRKGHKSDVGNVEQAFQPVLEAAE